MRVIVPHLYKINIYGKQVRAFKQITRSWLPALAAVSKTLHTWRTPGEVLEAKEHFGTSESD